MDAKVQWGPIIFSRLLEKVNRSSLELRYTFRIVIKENEKNKNSMTISIKYF